MSVKSFTQNVSRDLTEPLPLYSLTPAGGSNPAVGLQNAQYNLT